MAKDFKNALIRVLIECTYIPQIIIFVIILLYDLKTGNFKTI